MTVAGEAPDLREQGDCPSAEACQHGCDQHPPSRDTDTLAEVRLTDAEMSDLRAAFERDKWAGEWNSLPTAVERILAARVEQARAGETALREAVTKAENDARLCASNFGGTEAVALGHVLGILLDLRAALDTTGGTP